ncbi:RDD family protein [Marinifilum flexuosum]|uniref:Putative RDD family membrane protein YckC n=1 Tax=Marinifilum flexuosum TaxID=1117708 RepID=A0A419X9U7_9BACT|nr:RDD family protein [Marinifilum flexuosum]RKE04537.1 putative RDD family membrane protein YckC [Marinifilum flexuosum]
MSKIGIETTQNVQLNFPLASVGERIAAYLLDALFVGVCAFFIAMVVGLLGEAFAIGFVFLVPVLFYSLLFETFMNGQTPGKRIMKIKVCKINGDAPGFIHYLIRWMFRLVDIGLTNGVAAILTIVIGEKGQRIGDILAKTTVVKTNHTMKLSNTILSEVPDNYQLIFPESRKVVDKDLELFKRVIQQLKTMDDPVEKLTFGLKARAKVMEQLGMKTEMPPEQFFQTLIDDYNFIHKNV